MSYLKRCVFQDITQEIWACPPNLTLETSRHMSYAYIKHS